MSSARQPWRSAAPCLLRLKNHHIVAKVPQHSLRSRNPSAGCSGVIDGVIARKQPMSAPPCDLGDSQAQVSGTNLGMSSYLKRLLEEKVDQTKRGASNLPAMAAVVGFKALEIALSPIEGTP